MVSYMRAGVGVGVGDYEELSYLNISSNALATNALALEIST